LSLLSIPLIFLCGFAWSLFDLSRKRLGYDIPVFQALFLFMWVQLPIFLIGAWSLQSFEIAPDYWVPGLIGVGINFVANALFIASVTMAPLGLTVPMLSLASVFSAIVSFFFLGEILSGMQIFGILLVTLGAFILNGKPSFKDRHKKGAWLMALAAFFWGAMAAVDKICMQHISSSLHGAFQTGGIALIATFILWRKSQILEALRRSKNQGFNLSLGTFASVAAILLQLHIIQTVAVGLFEALKRVFAMTLSVFWGKVLYREPITRNKVFSLLLMALGLVFLLASKPVQAQNSNKWDLAFDLGLRSYPSGAAAALQAGWNQKLWGSNESGDFRYGYYRLGARVQSSGVVNRADASFSFFPISLTGIELTTGMGHRNLKKISTLDCAVGECAGSVYRTSLRVPLFLGIGKVFTRMRYEYQWVKAPDAEALLADEATNLMLQAAGDTLQKWDLMLGYTWREDVKSMAFYEQIESSKAKTQNQRGGLILNKAWSEHNLYLGFGLYKSTTSAQTGQLFAAYSYTFSKGLGF
jgi:drug/metabolite transporter (DMT)-like permease